MKTTEVLVQKLIDSIHSSHDLKLVSDTLEELADKKTFREHSSAIVTDPNLTLPQKRQQLLYLIRSLDIPVLYQFFSTELTTDKLWLFARDKIDYFDRFVRAFQMSTEQIDIVNLVTAVPLGETDIKAIALDLGKAFASKVLVNHEVDPDIIGGAQIRVENLIFDFSLRTKFSQFEHQWLASVAETGDLTGRYQE